MALYLFNDEEIAILRQVIATVGNINGDGVTNAPGGITIGRGSGGGGDISGGGGGVTSGGRRPVPHIHAKITADDGDGTYSATEQVWTSGAWANKSGGLVWDGTGTNLPQLTEMNSLPGTLVGDVVEVLPTSDSTAVAQWRFFGIGLGVEFPILMSQTGGSAGDDTTQCSYTYTVTNRNSVSLGTGVNPTSSPHEYKRPSAGEGTAATAGIASYKLVAGVPTLVISSCNELIAPAVAVPAVTFAVTMSQTGGSAGSKTTACSFTYTVTDALTGSSLGTGVNPSTSPHVWKRTSLGKYVAATSGLAYYNSTPALVIAWCNEVPEVSAC
jgi:hypothetical protein